MSSIQLVDDSVCQDTLYNAPDVPADVFPVVEGLVVLAILGKSIVSADELKA